MGAELEMAYRRKVFFRFEIIFKSRQMGIGWELYPNGSDKMGKGGLDYSFARTLLQAIKRAVRRSLTKEELWEGTGNRESFRKSFFSKESIIWWTITTHKKNRLKYESYLVDPRFSHLKFIRLKSHAEAENFLKTLNNKNPLKNY